MLIDDYEVVDEKQEVAIITPTESPDEPDARPRADDCECRRRDYSALGSLTEVLDEAMKKKLMPEIPDLEIESEGYSTWNIVRYRSLTKKERGPIFKVGGHPWYVKLEQCIKTLPSHASQANIVFSLWEQCRSCLVLSGAWVRR